MSDDTPNIPDPLKADVSAGTAIPEPKVFGPWLKQQRLDRRVSLEEIAAVTKVHITQLRSLEEDLIEKLPAAAFVRGFLVSYARHLSLDESEVLEKFKARHSTLTPISEMMQIPVARTIAGTHNRVSMVTSPQMKQAPSSRDMDSRRVHVFTPRNVMLFALLVGVGSVLIFLVGLGKKLQKSSQKTPVAAEVQNSVVTPPAAGDLAVAPGQSVSAPSPTVPAPAKLPVIPCEATKLAIPAVVPTPSTSAAVSPIATPTATPPVLPIAGKYKIEVRAIEPNWLNIRVDEEGSKGMMLKSASPVLFEANRRVVFSFSDAGNVEIRWNGVWYAPPGSRGDVKTLTLPDQLATLVLLQAKAPVKKAPVSLPGTVTLPAATTPAAAIPPPPAAAIPPPPAAAIPPPPADTE